jgi:hypothetical protein
MRKIIKHIVVIAILVCFPVFMSNIFADQPPDPGGGPGGGDDPVGGGSSLGGSMITMILLGLAYGSSKFFSIRKKLLE